MLFEALFIQTHPEISLRLRPGDLASTCLGAEVTASSANLTANPGDFPSHAGTWEGARGKLPNMSGLVWAGASSVVCSVKGLTLCGPDCEPRRSRMRLTCPVGLTCLPHTLPEAQICKSDRQGWSVMRWLEGAIESSLGQSGT